VLLLQARNKSSSHDRLSRKLGSAIYGADFRYLGSSLYVFEFVVIRSVLRQQFEYVWHRALRAQHASLGGFVSFPPLAVFSRGPRNARSWTRGQHGNFASVDSNVGVAGRWSLVERERCLLITQLSLVDPRNLGGFGLGFAIIPNCPICIHATFTMSSHNSSHNSNHSTHLLSQTSLPRLICSSHSRKRRQTVTSKLSRTPLINPLVPCLQALFFHERCLAAGHSIHRPAPWLSSCDNDLACFHEL